MIHNSLMLQPIDFDEACEFVRQHHRHHKPPQGHKFSIAANNGVDVVGVAIVGRPVSRHIDAAYEKRVKKNA